MLITNFSSGELSKALSGRIDLNQYYKGAGRIENFEIIPTGGIKRRAGTKRLLKTTEQSRLIPFILDKDNVYLIEAKIELFVIWQYVNGALTKVDEIETPYLSKTEIDELQYAQNYDTIVFVHRNYKPCVLKWIVEGNTKTFGFNEMEFDFYPDIEIDDDFDYIMLSVDNSGSGTGGLPVKDRSVTDHARFTYYTLVGNNIEQVSKDFPEGLDKFYAVYNGKLYEWDETNGFIAFGMDPESETDLFTAPGKYPGCVAFFNSRLYFASSINSRQKIWASAAPDTKGVRYTDFATYKKYVTVNKTLKDSDMHVFTCDIYLSNIDTQAGTTRLTNVTQDYTRNGALAKDVTSYFITGEGIPEGTKVLSVESNSIVINAALDLEEDTRNLVCSIQLWRSAETTTAEDYEYLTVANNVTTADCSFNFEFASDENDAVMFLASNKFLTVGTESSVWSIPSGVSAVNLAAVMQGRYGSDNIQGQAVETATVYFSQGKKGIREFYYSEQTEAFITNNIAILADQMLRESPAVDFDYMTNPYSRLIVLREDGKCVCMLYDKSNGIMGWNRLTHHCPIKSVAVTRGPDEYDLVFFTVKDGDEYWLEVMDYGAMVFLDSYAEYDDNAADYDETAILYNATQNKTCAAANVPSGFIGENDIVYIGYEFMSYIKSMPVINSDSTGKKRIVALLVRFLDSFMPVMKINNLPDEKFTQIDDTKEFSGVAKITYPGTSDYDVTFELKTTRPQPVNILCVDALVS